MSKLDLLYTHTCGFNSLVASSCGFGVLFFVTVPVGFRHGRGEPRG